MFSPKAHVLTGRLSRLINAKNRQGKDDTAAWCLKAEDDPQQHWPTRNTSGEWRYGLAPGPRAVVGRAVSSKKGV